MNLPKDWPDSIPESQRFKDHKRDAESPSDSPLRTELTPIGEQFVIPGCEKDIRRGPKQPSLWDAPQQEKEAKK